MMARSKKQSALLLTLTLVAVVVAWSIKGQESKPEDKMVSGEAEQINVSELSDVQLKSKEFDILKHCSLIKHLHNDGDSFHVKHGKEETEFRLYYVDATENKFKRYKDGSDNGERLRDQGVYFGGLDMQVTIEMGRVAQSFVLDLLSKEHFTVVTKWENVFTPERKYCYVIVNWNGKDAYLHELLIAKGLARIITLGTTLPDETTFYKHREKLNKIEQQAKTAKRGAWGM